METQKLITADLRTDAWRRFTQDLQAELQRLRESNDDPGKDAVATALLRGRIKTIKEILTLDAKASSLSEGAVPKSWDEVPVIPPGQGN